MAIYASLFKAVIFFFSKILHFHYKTPRNLHRKFSNASLHHTPPPPHPKLHKYPSFDTSARVDNDSILIFNVEEAVLRSSSLFPYFMLVAFEAGSPIRALILLMLYPLICLFKKQMRVNIMVMVCFLGIKKASFNVGKAVLPKFFLEDVGVEGFEVLNKFKRKVGVSDMPNVMVDSFLRDYLEINHVFGRQLKVYCGYFTGLMAHKKSHMSNVKDLFGDGDDTPNVVGFSGTKASLNHPFFSFCKTIYLTSDAIKKKWQQLPRENYPKPLIFHDGRLSLKPTPTTTFALFLWLPFAFFLAVTRALIVMTLPQNIGTPLIAFLGIRLLCCGKGTPQHNNNNNKGQLYVCNHRTLLDPLYLSYALRKPLTAVTYSLSKLSEILAPIKTVRLRRDRVQDGMMMQSLLSQGDLVVCPEGTTCREPYLLRFSPLFAEMSDLIVPVAMDCYVSMFYGTTASGLKCFDPLFFLLNPHPSYTIQLLDPVQGVSKCENGSQSRFDVANHVQAQIGDALNFKCTRLTRKDKYLILAGNHGVV